MPGAERSAGAVRQRDVAIPDLHRRMRFAAQLPYRLKDLSQPAAVRRVVVAQPAAVGVERQFPDPGDQIAVADEAAALPLLAKAEILELHDDGDREAVVDRGVSD